MQNLENYYKTRAKKSMGSGCIFLNKKGEILLVKPTYKDYWALPGGGVEEKESPMSGCIREIKEEINLEIDKLNFICVDYRPYDGRSISDSLEFIFYGGILNEKDIKKIKLAKGEIENFKFAGEKEAFSIIGGGLKNRLPTAIKLLKNNSSSYLENSEIFLA